jgi:hypothetical protein
MLIHSMHDLSLKHGHELDKFYNYASNPTYILDVSHATSRS